jgi:hypothetical protein
VAEEEVVKPNAKGYKWATLFLGGGNKYRNLALHVRAVSNLRQEIVVCPAGLGPDKDCACEAHQQL